MFHALAVLAAGTTAAVVLVVACLVELEQKTKWGTQFSETRVATLLTEKHVVGDNHAAGPLKAHEQHLGS